MKKHLGLVLALLVVPLVITSAQKEEQEVQVADENDHSANIYENEPATVADENDQDEDDEDDVDAEDQDDELDDDQDDQVLPEELQKLDDEREKKSQAHEIFEQKNHIGVFPEKDFDPEAKRAQVEALVHKGVAYFGKHSADQAFHAFNNDKEFLKGDLYLFVFNSKGICLAHGDQDELIWKDLSAMKDSFGVPIVQAVLEKARQGGGWITFQWRNATSIAYIKEVKKDGETYVVGSGYYPHSKVDAVVNLVKGAVALFNEVIKQGRQKEEALGTFSYPMGRFIYGDLYLYALDFKGMQLAHGENPELIGTNAWMYKDAKGKLVNQEIIEKLKKVDFGTGIWIDYMSRNAPKRAYAEKVKDDKGNVYFIACGYYPDADRKHTEELVERGYRYMKGNGKSQAVAAFTDKANNEFRYGDLYLFVYTTKGVCVAHGGNPTLVGTNMLEAKDDDGMLYVKEMIKKAEDGGGWVNYKEKNAFRSAYVEKLNMGTEQYIIGSAIHPISKVETMLLLAKGAADYLRNHDIDDSCKEFVNTDGKFIRGDLSIFVCDAAGICFVNGDEYNLIWKNLMDAKDDTGKPYVKIMLNTVRKNHGPATITYQLHGATRAQYVEPVEKKGKLYLVGSGFYY